MIKFEQDFKIILDEENKLLDKMLSAQKEMRASIIEKDWEKLSNYLNHINNLSEEFQLLDAERDVVQEMLNYEELKPFYEKLGILREKLLRYKIENQAISKYVDTLKKFIKGVVDNALPQSRSKIYTKKGIYQPQPQSVVINKLY